MAFEAESQNMKGKVPGWYEGWWTDPSGSIGGWIFYPIYFGYKGDEEKPSTVTPDMPPRVLKYWDGENILDDRPRS